MSDNLSSSAILEYSIELLGRGGYRVFRDQSEIRVPSSLIAVAEDPYGILAIVVFETWSELIAHWSDAQAGLVRLLDKRLGQLDPKSWDGYLLLFCPMNLTREQRQEKTAVESNLNRVRKMIFADEQLSTLNDVEQALSPVLPISTSDAVEFAENILSALPGLISGPSLTPKLVAAVVEAFQDGRPVQDEIFRQLESKQ